jgi:hypothetical protein
MISESGAKKQHQHQRIIGIIMAFRFSYVISEAVD